MFKIFFLEAGARYTYEYCNWNDELFVTSKGFYFMLDISMCWAVDFHIVFITLLSSNLSYCITYPKTSSLNDIFSLEQWCLRSLHSTAGPQAYSFGLMLSLCGFVITVCFMSSITSGSTTPQSGRPDTTIRQYFWILHNFNHSSSRQHLYYIWKVYVRICLWILPRRMKIDYTQISIQWMYSWILIAFRSKIYSTDCDIAAQIKVLKYEKKAK